MPKHSHIYTRTSIDNTTYSTLLVVLCPKVSVIFGTTDSVTTGSSKDYKRFFYSLPVVSTYCGTERMSDRKTDRRTERSNAFIQTLILNRL